MHTPITAAQPPQVQNVPLPGFHECLTLQLNVTVYRAGENMKFVAILRDPVGSTEFDRRHGAGLDVSERDTSTVIEAVRSQIALAEYLIWGR